MQGMTAGPLQAHPSRSLETSTKCAIFWHCPALTSYHKTCFLHHRRVTASQEHFRRCRNPCFGLGGFCFSGAEFGTCLAGMTAELAWKVLRSSKTKPFHSWIVGDFDRHLQCVEARRTTTKVMLMSECHGLYYFELLKGLGDG
jgi:hypothetical protein